ncbi:SDR family NAD(P)-dependent oxidoreductase [Phenylobacterium sp. LjRoot225]|uniref:SDR family NAD(P)-dependent oxidoreductase n=1 Tax=Phenylobacterium sp. LjRoot225 TaxID=3342285 RepID=UPI003ECE8912
MTAKTRARVAVVTGASSGIGLEAAKALAAAGWRVIGVGRDPGRSAAAEAEIRAAAAAEGRVEMLKADLSLMADAARLAQEVAARTDRVDVLLNNAGGIGKERVVTSEGAEATFAGNHLGHFLLTSRLLPLLRAAAADQPRGAVRVVNVSSSAHLQSSGLDFDDLQRLGNFSTVGAYANAKLANILFTRELAKRLSADGIVAHAMHPGLVATNFASRGDETMQRYYEGKKDLAITAQAGADTLIWLATAEEPGSATGGYFHNRAPGELSPAAQDEAAAERLWAESEALIARAGV